MIYKENFKAQGENKKDLLLMKMYLFEWMLMLIARRLRQYPVFIYWEFVQN